MILSQYYIISSQIFLTIRSEMVIIQMICLTDQNTERGNQSLTTQVITEMEKNLMTIQAEITSGIFARK